MTQKTLEISNISTRYGQIPMLMNVSLEIRKGHIACVLGANGAGKTTLLKAILGMVKADTGSIKLNGESIDHLPTHKRVEKGIAMAAAAFGTLHKMTVEKNLKMGAYYINDNKLLNERLETVTKLQRYDQENNTEYYKTMEAFIKYNGNVNETAKHLCVHYNTVKYRLNTIKKILGINIEDPDKRLDFQIGMKIANLLKLKV
jgi:ABC-type sugar transport system ATPase subunit